MKMHQNLYKSLSKMKTKKRAVFKFENKLLKTFKHFLKVLRIDYGAQVKNSQNLVISCHFLGQSDTFMSFLLSLDGDEKWANHIKIPTRVPYIEWMSPVNCRLLDAIPLIFSRKCCHWSVSKNA
jgi:hypothetical protein